MIRIDKMRRLLQLRREGVDKTTRIETVQDESGELLSDDGHEDVSELVDDEPDDLTSAFPEEA